MKRDSEKLPTEAERYELTLEALADVNAGRVVDHEAVRAWAESLAVENSLPPLPRNSTR